MSEEKRRATRVKKPISVQYIYGAKENGHTWDMTTVKDISQTGISFVVNTPFSPGQIIDIRLKVPSYPFKWVELRGKIVSADNFVGTMHMVRIDFVDLADEQKKIIAEYVSLFLNKENKGGPDDLSRC